MGLQIKRTPNGRFYVFNDAVEQGYRCSPYFKTLDEMVQRVSEIDSVRRLHRRSLKNWLRLEYSRGWLPLKEDKIPLWLQDVVPGKDGSKEPIIVRDRVYFWIEEEDDYVKGTVVERHKDRDFYFKVISDDYKYHRWEEERYLPRIKPNV